MDGQARKAIGKLRRAVEKLSLVLLAFLLIPPGKSSGAEGRYVYLWYPRNNDISADATASDAVILKALLNLVPVQTYTVQPGDNPDFVIRKLFLVSSSIRNAYRLYQERLCQLNPNLASNGLLKPGDKLLVPAGPKYGATELDTQTIPVGLYTRVFTRMSKASYFGPARQNQATIADLQTKVARSLKQFVLPGKAALQAASQTRIYQEALKRGLVPPINTSDHPGERLTQAQALPVLVTDSTRTMFQSLTAEDKQGSLLPGLLPVADNQKVPCDTGCVNCGDSLHVPNGLDLSAARVLIEDTGISLGVPRASSNLLYKPPNDDGRDNSPDSHGTFIFNQLSTCSKGLFGKGQLFVAKVTRPDTTGQISYYVPDILAALQAFSNQMKSSSSPPRTWVVNLSAAGEPFPDATFPNPPALPQDPNILVVAAAGNEGSPIAPINQAFARMSNGNTTLLIVGALTTQGTLADYSNTHRTNVQLFAQGDCVCGSPGQLNGTSQATPLVAAAAAVLASVRRDWAPRFVMWRLITTADRVPALRGKALAGPVNLMRALDKRIQVATSASGGQTPQTQFVASIRFDGEWGEKVVAAETEGGLPLGMYPILRLFDGTTNAGEACFKFLQFTDFSERSLCVAASSTITVMSDAGGSQTLHASDVRDIVLPMPPDRDGELPQLSLR